MPTEPPHNPPPPVLGVRRRRMLLFMLAVAAIVATLFIQPEINAAVQAGRLQRAWAFFSPVVYGGLWLGFCVDRWLAVQRRGYSLGQALFQVAFGLLVGLLLTPAAQLDFRRPGGGLQRWLHHSDPALRQLAVEAAGYRGPSPERISGLLERLGDKAPGVRQQALGVLCTWSGLSACDIEGVRRWADSQLAAARSKKP